MTDSEKKSEPVEIPVSAVAPETLAGIVEEFVLREGTDYGAIEVSLSAKVSQVLKQIERGDTKIFFDPETESVTLVPRR